MHVLTARRLAHRKYAMCLMSRPIFWINVITLKMSVPPLDVTHSHAVHSLAGKQCCTTVSLTLWCSSRIEVAYPNVGSQSSRAFFLNVEHVYDKLTLIVT